MGGGDSPDITNTETQGHRSAEICSLAASPATVEPDSSWTESLPTTKHKQPHGGWLLFQPSDTQKVTPCPPWDHNAIFSITTQNPNFITLLFSALLCLLNFLTGPGHSLVVGAPDRQSSRHGDASSSIKKILVL